MLNQMMSEPIGLDDSSNIVVVIEAMRMARHLGIEYLTALALLEASGW